jgi:type IV pilus assembly protein PilC
MTIVLVGIAVLLWGAFLGTLLFFVPRFERTFAEFKLRLPHATAVTLDASRWMVKYWYVLVLMAIPGLPTAVALSHLVRRSASTRWLAVLWFILLLGVPLAGQVYVWCSILIPYADLVEALGGVKGR